MSNGGEGEPGEDWPFRVSLKACCGGRRISTTCSATTFTANASALSATFPSVFQVFGTYPDSVQVTCIIFHDTCRRILIYFMSFSVLS